MEKLTVKQAREQSGLPAKYINKCIGVSQASYYRYEAGNYMPAETLEKFAIAVDIPVTQIKCRDLKESSWRHTAIRC